MGYRQPALEGQLPIVLRRDLKDNALPAHRASGWSECTPGYQQNYLPCLLIEIPHCGTLHSLSDNLRRNLPHGAATDIANGEEAPSIRRRAIDVPTAIQGHATEGLRSTSIVKAEAV